MGNTRFVLTILLTNMAAANFEADQLRDNNNIANVNNEYYNVAGEVYEDVGYESVDNVNGPVDVTQVGQQYESLEMQEEPDTTTRRCPKWLKIVLYVLCGIIIAVLITVPIILLKKGKIGCVK